MKRLDFLDRFWTEIFPERTMTMKLADFLRALREKFYAELSAKTGWGREELKVAFERAISNVLAHNTTLVE